MSGKVRLQQPYIEVTHGFGKQNIFMKKTLGNRCTSHEKFQVSKHGFFPFVGLCD